MSLFGSASGPGAEHAQPVRLMAALRESLGAGYRATDLRKDVLAGITVGIVALPLSMALAITSGAPPQNGLYTAIVAGALIALLGGSRVQVSGPTAAFVVLLAPITAQFGLGGLVLATVLAGLILIALGLARLGQLIQYIPHPVVSGFTSGIAVVIASLQLRDFFGLTLRAEHSHFIERIADLATALGTLRLPDTLLALFTLALLIFWPRISRHVPSPLVAMSLSGAAAWALARYLPQWSVPTIGSRFHYMSGGLELPGIPQLPPQFALPWNLPGADGLPVGLSQELLAALLPAAFAIAMLGAIESLLSATVADGMTGMQHDPDAELLAQGVGNIGGAFFGGFAATGALARTATNIRSGARSPLAAVVHALFVLAAVLLLAPLLAWLPMAGFAALLMIVAWNMSEAKHFVRALRISPRSDKLVMLTCFGLTVFFDMVVAVSAGVMLAGLLFIRRMIEISGAEFVTAGSEAGRQQELPEGVVLYRIAGPLFFGAASKALSSLRAVDSEVHVLILDLSAVPAIDATGLVNLEAVLDKMHSAQTRVILVGLQAQPQRVMEQAGMLDEKVSHYASCAEALEHVRARARR